MRAAFGLFMALYRMGLLVAAAVYGFQYLHHDNPHDAFIALAALIVVCTAYSRSPE